MASLQIPIGIWKNAFGLGEITAILGVPELGHLFLGTRTGRIYRLDCDGTKLQVALFLAGHAHKITSLGIAYRTVDQRTLPSPVLLSLDCCGELAMWTVEDGRCLLHNIKAIDGEPTDMLVLSGGEYVLLGGNTSKVNVLRLGTLECCNTAIIPNTHWLQSATCIPLENSTYMRVLLAPVQHPLLYSFVVDGANGRIVAPIEPVATLCGNLGPLPKGGSYRGLRACGTKAYYTDGAALWSLDLADPKLEMRVEFWEANEYISQFWFMPNVPGTSNGPRICLVTGQGNILALEQGQILWSRQLTRTSVLTSRRLCLWGPSVLAIEYSGNTLDATLLPENQSSAVVLNTGGTSPSAGDRAIITAAATWEVAGSPVKMIYGHADGTIQIQNLCDAFVAEYEQPKNADPTAPDQHLQAQVRHKVAQASISLVHVLDLSQLLLVGDVQGRLYIWSLAQYGAPEWSRQAH